MGVTMETVRDFIILGSKITADGEIKRHLLLLGSRDGNFNSRIFPGQETEPVNKYLKEERSGVIMP